MVLEPSGQTAAGGTIFSAMHDNEDIKDMLSNGKGAMISIYADLINIQYKATFICANQTDSFSGISSGFLSTGDFVTAHLIVSATKVEAVLMSS